jgi:hypothetical protein
MEFNNLNKLIGRFIDYGIGAGVTALDDDLETQTWEGFFGVDIGYIRQLIRDMD